jgi:hypothetical protein
VGSDLNHERPAGVPAIYRRQWVCFGSRRQRNRHLPDHAGSASVVPFAGDGILCAKTATL